MYHLALFNQKKSLLQSRDVIWFICHCHCFTKCLFPGGQKLKQDAFVQMMEQPFPEKRKGVPGPRHLHPPPTSIHLSPEANRQWSSMVRGAMHRFVADFNDFDMFFVATVVHWQDWLCWGFSWLHELPKSQHLLWFWHILPSYCRLQELPFSGNGSMERCGYQWWHWGFNGGKTSQGFNKVMTVDAMGRSPNFSIAGWSRANLLATPRRSVMLFLRKVLE